VIKLNKNRDLTTGSITGGLWSFAVPLMLGNVFQQFYNLADTWMVGKYLGTMPLRRSARHMIDFLCTDLSEAIKHL
jgi:Na+-driven multidrug efflux pump